MLTLGASQSSLGLAEESLLASNPFEQQEEEFLHVDKAYTISVRQNQQQLTVEWMIADKYFLYGEQFRFSVNGKEVPATRPAGKRSYDEIFEKEVEKYYVYTQAVIDKAALPSDTPFTLSVRYQGCADAGLCYPPETKNFTVSADGITQNKAAPSRFALGNSPENTSSNPKNGNTPTQTTDSSGFITLLIALGSALIGGAILNLMPCVFPVLSIKAFSLVNNTNHASRIRHGWSYTAGTLITFIAIACLLLIIRSAGQSIGWGFQLQEPAVITSLALLFFVMGLSLSGLVHFGSRWMGAGQSLTQGDGLSHSFFTGVLAAVVASPCTAPFMASALGYALTQPPFIAISIFAALGLGMALPFLLLSHLPQLGKFLPQPGLWMDTFKQALAFPLYITSVWLLWVLGQQIGTNAVILAILGAIGITFAFWLNQKISKGQTLINILCIALVIGVVWQNKNHTSNTESLWQPYTQAKLSGLRQEGKAVFVNLTADWCITCKVNEKLVFTPDTLQGMIDKEIHLLEGDWTNYNAEITYLLDQYGRGGVPLYLLFPAKTSADAKILPQILTPASFKRYVDEN